MSTEPEMVEVEIHFTTEVRFHETVSMRRDTYEQLCQQIDDDDAVDLTEWIDWCNPCDVGDSDILEFELKEAE